MLAEHDADKCTEIVQSNDGSGLYPWTEKVAGTLILFQTSVRISNQNLKGMTILEHVPHSSLQSGVIFAENEQNLSHSSLGKDQMTLQSGHPSVMHVPLFAHALACATVAFEL